MWRLYVYVIAASGKSSQDNFSQATQKAFENFLAILITSCLLRTCDTLLSRK